jgi:hypothetical protein
MNVRCAGAGAKKVFLALVVAIAAAGCGAGASGSPDLPPDAPDAVGDAPSDVADPGLADEDLAAGDTDDTADLALPDLPTDLAADVSGDLGPLPDWPQRPALVTRPDRKAAILAHAATPPWDAIVARVRATAAGTCAQDTNPKWNVGVHQSNGAIAQANAVLAWLFDEEAAADKARRCFTFIRTDWETSTGENHTMAGFQIPFAIAWDLMAGTSRFPADESAEARTRLVTVNEKFFDTTVLDDFNRWTMLTVTHNNILIRSTAAMAYTALAFPDAPRSREILDFAAGELAYVWGPDGRYIGEDGVVSEEPFYFGYGFPPALAFFLAMRNAWPAEGVLHRNCINRNDVDPWAPIDCTDGQPVLWEDPVAAPGTNAHADRFWGAFDWSLDHRMPSGLRSTTGDGKARTQNGGLLLAALSGRGRYAWDARHTPDGTVDMGRGLDLTPQHLFDITTAPADEEPPPTSTAHLVSGHVTLRSGWAPDALWILFLGESGPARKTLHDHADGTSYAMAAYGEHLLLDAGYYKPNANDNAVTADAPSHNVILIDGQGAPVRGLLNDWGDADASLDRFVDGPGIDYAEVSQSYQQATIRRSMVLVRNRYAVVADRVETLVNGPREHTWRVNGFAGQDSGGSYALDANGATFQRAAAGIHVAIASTADAPEIREPPFVEGAAPHVHDIGDNPSTSHHAVADAVVSAVAPGFLAILAPWKVGAADGSRDAPLVLTNLASGGGSAAWTVAGVHGTDVVWLRAPDGPATLDLPGGRQIRTDAALVIVNLDDGLLVYRGGTGVTWDGTLHTAPTAADGLCIASPGP